MKKILPLFLAVLMSSSITSCDEHISDYDNNIHVGMVLCSDGRIRSLEEVKTSSSVPTAVIFHALTEEDAEGTAFAVYLHDTYPTYFADTVGSSVTSGDITELDGNINTYKLFVSGKSPMADRVYSLWCYGQSAYVPSVAQWRLLYRNRDVVNRVIESLGGDVLSVEPDKCWYWTSTEVSGQQAHKAWLFSVESGEIHETPKDQSHKIRPIVTTHTTH